MTYLVLVNAKSGTVRDRGRAAIKSQLESVFGETDTEADIRMIHPRDLEGEIKEALRRESPPERIVVGGGDGSLSTAARLLADTGTALGILPLGTMNLMARALNVPLNPADAVRALFNSRPVRIDLVEINGRNVLLHASIGLQPKVIKVREVLPYRTRFMRLVNGVIAWLRATRKLQPVRITVEVGNRSFERLTSALLISNNALPEGIGETPVSQDMTRGEIAVYVSSSRRRSDLVKLALATTLGVWRQSDQVEEFRTKQLDIDADKESLVVSVDGELVKLDTPLRCRVRPRCLVLLMPVSR